MSWVQILPRAFVCGCTLCVEFPPKKHVPWFPERDLHSPPGPLGSGCVWLLLMGQPGKGVYPRRLIKDHKLWSQNKHAARFWPSCTVTMPKQPQLTLNQMHLPSLSWDGSCSVVCEGTDFINAQHTAHKRSVICLHFVGRDFHQLSRWHTHTPSLLVLCYQISEKSNQWFHKCNDSVMYVSLELILQWRCNPVVETCRSRWEKVWIDLEE